MNGSAAGPRHLFVIRIWYERDPSGQVQRRGQAEHVASGVRIYFTALRDLDDFIDGRSKEDVTIQSEGGLR